MTLSPEDIEALATRTADELATRKKAHWVDPEIHAEHHTWVASQIAAEQERAEFWRVLKQKVIASAAIWAIPILITAIVVASWESVVSRLRDGSGS